MEFYIGQIFEDIYPPEAAEWCNSNDAMIVEIDPVVRTVTEEYETVEEEIKVIPAVTHIETDEEGNEREVIDVPEHEETIYNPVTKTREVEKELRCFRIDAIPEPPEPTVEEKNEAIKQTRANLYAKLIDPLHAEKQRKVVLGTWTDADEAEYVEQVKALTAKIQEENPYIE
jgi:hypothetical protein